MEKIGYLYSNKKGDNFVFEKDKNFNISKLITDIKKIKGFREIKSDDFIKAHIVIFNDCNIDIYDDLYLFEVNCLPPVDKSIQGIGKKSSHISLF